MNFSFVLNLNNLTSNNSYTPDNYGVMGNTTLQIILLLILISINAFFAMSEIAIISLNHNKLKKMAQNGHKLALKILNITENSSNFLATIQVGVTLSGFLTSASASTIFASKVSDFLSSFWHVSKSFLDATSTVLITVILSYLSLVFGELVPKKIAIQNAEKISFKVVGIIATVEKIFNPFIRFLSASTNFILKLFGVSQELKNETVTEEEILMMLDVGSEKGIIDNKTKSTIENLFDFDDKSASEIMTHRTEIVAIEDKSIVLNLAKLAISSGYSRIPVYHIDIDNIIGIAYVKDLFKCLVDGSNINKISVVEIMRDVIYVPKTKKCRELFRELTELKTQIAIIVDEYGGTEGLITIEDLIESILGSIQDEYDNEQNEINKINENKFTVDGSTSIGEVSDLIGFSLPKGNYDTLSGLILEHLGRIPTLDEHPAITIKNATFTVEEVVDRKISKISVTLNLNHKEY